MARPLDDHVPVAEAQHRAGVALLLPELRNLLFELLVLGGQGGVDIPPPALRITRSRRSETSSISSLMSVNVRIPLKTTDARAVFLRISELVQPVLVDPEVVGELVEDGDPDLLLQLPGSRKSRASGRRKIVILSGRNSWDCHSP